MKQEKEEEKEPIESFTRITQENKPYRNLIMNVKFNVDTEEKLKEMFSETIKYLDCHKTNEKFCEIRKFIMKFNITDNNNSFIYTTKPQTLRIKKIGKNILGMSIEFIRRSNCFPFLKEWTEINIIFDVNISFVMAVDYSCGKIMVISNSVD